MSETPQEILQAWIGMGDYPTDAEMSLVTLERVREAIRAVLEDLRLRDIDCGYNARVTRLEAERDALRRDLADIVTNDEGQRGEVARLSAEIERLRVDADHEQALRWLAEMRWSELSAIRTCLVVEWEKDTARAEKAEAALDAAAIALENQAHAVGSWHEDEMRMDAARDAAKVARAALREEEKP